MPSFYKRVKTLFGFSKREMNGAIALIFLIIILLISPFLYTHYFSIDYSSYEDQRILDSLIAELESLETEENPPIISFQLFEFDPNVLPVDSLQLLGIPPFLSERVINYRKAGGVFRESEDLKKIYGMTDSLYALLEESISIERVFSKQVPSAEPKERDSVISKAIHEKEVKPLQVKINSADTTTFQLLNGIGSVYSNRIVKFRKALGGFASINQIAEVYGISDSLYQNIKSQLDLDSIELVRIPINTASFKEINRHPYISYEQTKALFNAKSKVGKFKTLQDLIDLEIFDSLSAFRLNDYLDFR